MNYALFTLATISAIEAAHAAGGSDAKHGMDPVLARHLERLVEADDRLIEQVLMADNDPMSTLSADTKDYIEALKATRAFRRTFANVAKSVYASEFGPGDKAYFLHDRQVQCYPVKQVQIGQSVGESATVVYVFDTHDGLIRLFEDQVYSSKSDLINSL